MLSDRLTNILYQKDLVREYLDVFQFLFDDIKVAAQVLKLDRWIDTAFGKQLDGCGQIVGEERQGRDDEAYREAIRYRIFVNTSQATPKDINTAVKILTKSSEQHYWDTHPVSYSIFTNGPDVPENISELLKDISPAGIGRSSVHVSYGSPAFFLSRASETSKLWLNGKKFLAAGKRLKISGAVTHDNGSHLGGISLPKLVVSGKNLRVGGKRLRLNSPAKQTIISSGTNLPGAFEI